MSGIQVSIGADFAALQQIQSRFEKAAAKIRDGFSQRIGQRAFDGILSATRALPNLIKSAVDAGSRLSDEMARTGAAGEGLVILRRAFENAGMAGDDVARILGVMQKSIAGLNEESKPTAAAKKEALLVAQRIQQGLQHVTDMTPSDRDAYAVAKQMPAESGIPLVAAIEDYLRARAIAAAECMLRPSEAPHFLW